MKTYPIMLDLRDRPVIVVGGGPVGLRKARSLCECGARVTLVAERFAPAAGMSAGAAPVVLAQPYAAEMLAGAALVFACTDDAALNARIAADARRRGVLVNVADQRDDCDFHVPAIARDGEVVVAVGTGGSAPALAGNIKRKLSAVLGERMGEFAALLGELRRQVQADLADAAKRRDIMRDLAGDETYRAFLADGPEAVRDKLHRLLSETDTERPR